MKAQQSPVGQGWRELGDYVYFRGQKPYSGVNKRGVDPVLTMSAPCPASFLSPSSVHNLTLSLALLNCREDLRREPLLRLLPGSRGIRQVGSSAQGLACSELPLLSLPQPLKLESPG